MQSRPVDLPDVLVAEAVSDGWGLPAVDATYQAVGYGSHHWSIEDASGARWFASVDLLDAERRESFDRLAAALEAAASARSAGLPFVVAPVRTRDGRVLRRLHTSYALALYPHVGGESGRFSDELTSAETSELVSMLCALHATGTMISAAGLGSETFALAGQGHLEAAVAESTDAARWRGPYGDRLRRLLLQHGNDIARVLREHDQLTATAGPQAHRFVLTHGEPHPGNVIRTHVGPMLVDWDTTLLAPPERDLWLLDARSNGQASREYAARAGRLLSSDLLDRYRLAWALVDISEFLVMLRHAHEETEDTAWSWEALCATLHALPVPGGRDSE